MLFSSLSLQIMQEYCVIAGDLKKKKFILLVYLFRVSSVLSKTVLTPQPEPGHATGLGCLAGLSYLQIVMTGTEEKKKKS